MQNSNTQIQREQKLIKKKIMKIHVFGNLYSYWKNQA